MLKNNMQENESANYQGFLYCIGDNGTSYQNTNSLEVKNYVRSGV
jgi:hypothetical protein